MDFREFIAKAKGLIEQAKAIEANAESSAEDHAKVPQLIEDAKAFQAKAENLKGILDSEQVLEHLDKLDEDKNKEKEGSAGEKKFVTWGAFLEQVWRASHPNIKAPPDPRLVFFEDEAPRKGKAKKDMTEGQGAAGGFLVPSEYLAELQAAIGENAIVRPRATRIPMRRRQLDIPTLDQTGAGAGLPHWFGGMQFYWEEEASEKTQTDPTFRKISLVAHKMIGYTRGSDELLDDSAISLEAFLAGPLGFAGGAAWMEDYAFLRGTGAGQPLGVINAGATLTVARAVAGAVGFADLANMLENFLPSAGRGVWIISQSLMSELIQLNGPAGNPSYIWTPNARDGIPGFLLGKPVIWSEKVPGIGNPGDVLLADFTYYLLGDRQATTVESTKFDRWRFDETSWRMVHRVDGQPWLSAPLTLQDGTTQVSPFVILGAAAAS